MTSTNIYSAFQPTFLYIKQHSKTGLLYFGKTCRNPEKYYGSGKHWLRHIKKHGREHVINLWYCLFYDRDECVEFATKFSIDHDIIKSEKWANMKGENGLDGNPIGIKFTPEHLEKITAALKNQKLVKCNFCEKDVTSSVLSQYHGNRCKLNPHRVEEPKFQCSFCKKFANSANYAYLHEDYCSENPNRLKKPRTKPMRICLHCGEEHERINHDKYHGDYCLVNPHRKERECFTCEFCGIKTLNKTNYIRWHGKNCKQSGNL